MLREINNKDYSIIKGEVLSIQAYGVPGKRISSDIDVLISRSDIRVFENIFWTMDSLVLFNCAMIELQC